MKILQNYVILNQLDLPTIEWKQFFDNTTLDSDLLWTIKVENGVNTSKENETRNSKRSGSSCAFLRKIQDIFCGCGRKAETRIENLERKSLIGVDADTAMLFGKKQMKANALGSAMVIYYPYYTVVKSGIVDINNERTVIEGCSGSVRNLIKNNQVDVTMIFKEDDLDIRGDEKLFHQEEMLPLIDHSKEVKKMAAADLERGKNLQLTFSFLYQTSVTLKPVGEQQLIFYKFKIF